MTNPEPEYVVVRMILPRRKNKDRTIEKAAYGPTTAAKADELYHKFMEEAKGSDRINVIGVCPLVDFPDD